jgi:3D (Asp-Asp-Asp) domain-containing protein
VPVTQPQRMLLARSLWRKGLITLLAIAGFVWLYEVTIPDSRFSMLPLGFELGLNANAAPTPGGRVTFTSTAYCKGMVTSSGVAVQSGIVASDPSLLPVGSVINLDINDDKYDGVYTVLDTGPAVQGREVDIYMWSCNEALAYGRRPARLTVMRLGWNPRATTPSLINRFLHRPETPAVLPSRPLPIIETPSIK